MKSKNSHRFKDLYGKRDKEVMYATANKLAQKKQTKQKTWKSGMGFKEEVVSETCETRYCRLCRKKETRENNVVMAVPRKYVGSLCSKGCN